jgi:hypothetical protein
MSRSREAGQASVELVALLPLIAFLALVCWQGVLAGEALWLSGSAARAAARAHAVGRDPAAAARAVLPGSLRRGLSVHAGADGVARVAVRVPAVVGHGHIATVDVRAGFRPQR